MTASTSSDPAALHERVPGVYFKPRPRAPEPPAVRTDVVGFIGFEPRVRDASPPSRLDGPAGHRFAVDVAAFQLVVGPTRALVARTPGLLLAAGPGPAPIADGQAIAYAVVAAEKAGALRLLVAAGDPTEDRFEVPPSDAAVTVRVEAAFLADGDPPALARARAWTRIADVVVRRRGGSIRLDVRPRLALTRCEDWNDFLLAFGAPRDDGTLLAPAVRAYFANGGGRCFVATVRRPDLTDPDGLRRARQEMVGDRGSSEAEATGLERLLLVDEVSVVDVPDLYARRVDVEIRPVRLPARDVEAGFIPCAKVLGPPSASSARGRRAEGDPLFAEADVRAAQEAMLLRCVPERWRVLLLLSVPLARGASGRFDPPSDQDAQRWRDGFDALVKGAPGLEPEEMSVAALYWPWVLEQERVDAPVVARPPSPLAAGVIARRDRARGPHVAPANETLRGVVGLSWPITDEVHGRLYIPPPDRGGRAVPGINVLRPFPGYGIQVWGARTLSTETWLRHLPVRRCLSAIERRVKVALDGVAFEPHTPLLWIQVTHLVLGVLLPIFDAGALRGERPEQAFFIRCDSSVNPPEQVREGRLVCEVGVAIAAPAEFLIFRIGRREGIVEVVE